MLLGVDTGRLIPLDAYQTNGSCIKIDFLQECDLIMVIFTKTYNIYTANFLSFKIICIYPLHIRFDEIPFSGRKTYESHLNQAIYGYKHESTCGG